MKEKIYKIIREEILREYHHSFGNGLEKDAENIANILLKFAKQYNINSVNIERWRLDDEIEDRLFVYHYYVKALGTNLNIEIDTRPEMSNNACINKGFVIPSLIVGYCEIENGIKDENGYIDLLSTIHHELGHNVNNVKSNNANSVSDKSFNTPLFLRLCDDEYKKISSLMYCFHRREMWARCFQTTMFLKKQKDKNLTIQDVYNNHCSRVSDMKQLLDLLNKIKNEGENGYYSFIMKNIFNTTYRKQLYSDKKLWFVNNLDISWEKMCNGTIKYFYSRYIWFKKRIDKIYYDYISS